MADLLAGPCRDRPDGMAVSDATGCDTYAELSVKSRAAAEWLWTQGVRRGDRVMLLLPGGRDFAALLYGSLCGGAIAVPVNPGTGDLHLRWMLQDAEPALIVADVAGSARVRALGDFPVRETPDLPADGGSDRQSWVGSTPETGDTALLMYTSGSTAMPRAVRCPHDRVRFAVAAIARRLRYRADDVVLCQLPISFDYALYQLFLAAEAAAHLVIRPELPHRAMLRMLREMGTTIFPVVPSLAEILVTLAQREPGPTALRMFTNTGAALTELHISGLRAAFPRAAIVSMYGMTECKRITISDPDEDLAHPGTVGRPLDGTTVAITNGDGESLPPGDIGEIWVQGPHVMAGYWHDPERTRARFDRPDEPTRALRTGDYGFLDADGRLYFVGRRDDIFKRREIRMSTAEVEAAALDVPGVVAAASVAPGADGELVLWVVGEVTPTRVLTDLAGRLDRRRVPDRCVVLDELPLTRNGKVDKIALRRGVDADRQVTPRARL
ncbi:class I adenylate-forming enzyme family protein [Micromonospora sp. RP3T]|uniref:class I adenylate-forming enzyme family protein n=1 Tax=Micromonospora sp. RP3T TaxID=2135446 RepID=UPI003D73D20D